jgi:16S rRNA (cytidine1402-2'-O)-methyltransferase
VASGLADEVFTFVGFLPRRGRERRDRVDEIVRLTHVVVLYESPVRTAATLADLAAAGARERQATVARELTKQYEEVRRGTVGDLAAYYASAPPRGEVTIVLGQSTSTGPDEQDWRTRAAALRSAGHAAREIADVLVNQGLPRNMAYRLAHNLGEPVEGEGKKRRPKND